MKSEEHNRQQTRRNAPPSQEQAAKRGARQAQQQKPRRKVRRSFWRRWGWGVAALVLVLIVGVIVWAVRAQASEIAGVVTYKNLSRDHVTGKVTYPQNPPVGGAHNAIWQNCGIYRTPVANENAVHSLEHGAVWITYQPQLGAQDIAQLQNLVRGHSYALLSPYPGLPAPVVASAWGAQLRVTSAPDPRLAQFLKKYEQGPQTPEPGAPCSGGTGTPDKR
ncbi:DUF3105 domain-containing protein [Dictyobacter formicarum]|uniref:DUF3105 domain-containing protein n=1 Tax=Dictyobacter formicarum TaxID=2778368 RepID=A0ABQ3VA60_9CHLR|nr:DUF3105 domain-containing protein [Dictyobacter formicarum]GHO82553.1 hypothetical protein KSZ_05590 [Dictyobacter formicarum]